MSKIFKLIESNVIQSPKMLTKYIEGLGWKHKRTNKHHIYVHEKASHRLAIPIGHGDLGRHLAVKLMKQAQELKEAIKPKESKNPDNAASRFDGSDSVVHIYKQDTPGESGSPKHKKKIRKKISEAFSPGKRRSEILTNEKIRSSQTRSLTNRNKPKDNIDVPPEKRASSLKTEKPNITDKEFESALKMKKEGKSFPQIRDEFPHVKPSSIQLRLSKHKKENP
jgi:predicted RNA binding protein YcfA (HicA-like mRNA interferase family)